MSARPLLLMVRVDEPPIQRNLVDLLGSMKASGALNAALKRFDNIEITLAESADAALKTLLAYFDKAACNTAILISDGLAQKVGRYPNESFMPTDWAKEVLHDTDGQLLGTISILDEAKRVPDIDRVLPRRINEQVCTRALDLTGAKLNYIAPPEKSNLVGRVPITIRPIHLQSELQDYYRLRHRIYRIMGYLEPEVEEAESGMEIDPCDVHSLHFGAYLQEGARERLVGASRIVAADTIDKRYEVWTSQLAKSDPVLKRRLGYFDPLGLPIFSSMNLNQEMVDVLTKQETCGELSRVIVDDGYRGRRLSPMLIYYALLYAAGKNVTSVFLECLPVHVGMYKKFGFETLPGVTGRVIGVDKTMVAMKLSKLKLELLRMEPASKRLATVMRSLGALKLCQVAPCGDLECDLYKIGKCMSE